MLARPSLRGSRPLLRYVWAFPATLVGLVFALPAVAAGAQWRVVDGTFEVAGAPVGWAVGMLPGPLQFSAITLGHVIIAIDPAALAECRLHEQVHVRQFERWGVLFFPLYIGSSLWQLVRGRSPYWHNHFERQAYREESTARRSAGCKRDT